MELLENLKDGKLPELPISIENDTLVRTGLAVIITAIVIIILNKIAKQL